jgi:hypothetical protein
MLVAVAAPVAAAPIHPGPVRTVHSTYGIITYIHACARTNHNPPFVNLLRLHWVDTYIHT